jgi:hypothetical protein
MGKNIKERRNGNEGVEGIKQRKKKGEGLRHKRNHSQLNFNRLLL